MKKLLKVVLQIAILVVDFFITATLFIAMLGFLQGSFSNLVKVFGIIIFILSAFCVATVSFILVEIIGGLQYD